MKTVHIFLIVIATTTMMLSGCLGIDKKASDGNETSGSVSDNKLIEYYYGARIQSNSSDNFTIYLPIVVHGYWSSLDKHPKDGLPSKVNEHIHVAEGNGAYRIVETEKGYALEVKSNASVTLAFNGSEIRGSSSSDIDMSGDRPNLRLSLVYDSDNDSRVDDEEHLQYWVNCTKSNTTPPLQVNVSLVLHYLPIHFEGGMEAHGIIENGWQIINGSMGGAAD
ncbi:MAG: hypothetical protein WC974_08050 [Thermoplasmata archaeon]